MTCISFRIFEAITFSLNIEPSWKPKYSIELCCLIQWPAKDILIPFTSFALENRMDLIFLIIFKMKCKLSVYEPLA